MSPDSQKSKITILLVIFSYSYPLRSHGKNLFRNSSSDGWEHSVKRIAAPGPEAATPWTSCQLTSLGQRPCFFLEPFPIKPYNYPFSSQVTLPPFPKASSEPQNKDNRTLSSVPSSTITFMIFGKNCFFISKTRTQTLSLFICLPHSPSGKQNHRAHSCGPPP